MSLDSKLDRIYELRLRSELLGILCSFLETRKGRLAGARSSTCFDGQSTAVSP